MPEKKKIPAEGKAVGAYSPGLTFGNLVFVSGQIANNLESSIEEQTKQCLEKVKDQIEGAGCEMNDILRCQVFLADINDFAKFNEVYAQYFSEPFPTRITVEAGSLPKGAKIEISSIAGKKD